MLVIFTLSDDEGSKVTKDHMVLIWQHNVLNVTYRKVAILSFNKKPKCNFFCSTERKFLQTETVISELKNTIAQQQIEISQQQADIQRLQVDSVYLVNESGNVSSRQKRQGISHWN